MTAAKPHWAGKAHDAAPSGAAAPGQHAAAEEGPIKTVSDLSRRASAAWPSPPLPQRRQDGSIVDPMFPRAVDPMFPKSGDRR